LERPDHWHLTPEDDCAFIGEYTAGAAYSHSVTNGLIANLKKKPSTRNTGQWRYKLSAIAQIGEVIRRNLTKDLVATFVPIPPSKPPGSPEYDDRMAQVAKAIGNVDVREVLFTGNELDPMHSNNSRRDLQELRSSLSVKNELLAPTSNLVILLDDVLTTGCSFKVCKSILSGHWPAAAFFGLFVARRVIDRMNPFGDVVDLDC